MAFDEKSRKAGRLLFILDHLVAMLVYVLAADLSVLLFPFREVDFLAHLSLMPLVIGVLAAILWPSGIYRRLRVDSMFSYGWTVLRGVVASLFVLGAVLFLMRAHFASRTVLLVYSAVLPVALITLRAGLIWWYFRKSVEKGENFMKVLIVGTGDRARRLSTKLHEHSDWGVDVIGYLDSDVTQAGVCVDPQQILGHVDQIESILQRNVVDEVIVAVPRTVLKDIQVIADVCEEEGVTLRFMADVFDLRATRMGLVRLDEIPLLTFEPVAQDESKLVVKRLFDLVITLAAMPLIAPVLLAVAIAVKLDSPGPAFFTQTRVGLRKRPFKMYKFRSMYVDAEQRLKDIEHLNEAQGPIFKIANDPRVTRVGRFIRKTSLDELPQLFNVLRGHMSLVGPRPMSLRDVGLFDRSIQRKRFSVRPGLTCLWQVSGRSNLPFEKWLELDLAYIDGWSLTLDFKVLLKTIPTVLKGSGAV
ncbi:MAG TPA: sugar transferase [Steroidobacteraceae bacterium]|nr:sugar transferase [Steroidobacteraceae bacterium]